MRDQTILRRIERAEAAIIRGQSTVDVFSTLSPEDQQLVKGYETMWNRGADMDCESPGFKAHRRYCFKLAAQEAERMGQMTPREKQDWVQRVSEALNAGRSREHSATQGVTRS